MRYLGQRILQSLILLVGVSVLSFGFIELSPGNFFDEIRLNPRISNETVSKLRSQYGMDQPLPVRYARWLGSVAKGEFGFSFAYNVPVASLLWPRARNTLLLTGSAMLLAWMLALPLGILSAGRRNGLIDHATLLLTAVLLTIPDLLMALGLLLFALRTRLLPAGGMMSLDAENLSAWKQTRSVAIHLVGPALVLALASLPTLIRHTRAAMIEALDSPFVRAARAHGLSPYRILFRHAFPVALNPLISLFGLSLGSLLSASLLTEVLVNWPGLGPLMLEAILGRDVYVVIGVVLFASAFLMCGTLLGDVLLFAADPRIRTEKLT
jgi:peptide/nickel transport system permease protein